MVAQVYDNIKCHRCARRRAEFTQIVHKATDMRPDGLERSGSQGWMNGSWSNEYNPSGRFNAAELTVIGAELWWEHRPEQTGAEVSPAVVSTSDDYLRGRPGRLQSLVTAIGVTADGRRESSGSMLASRGWWVPDGMRPLKGLQLRSGSRASRCARPILLKMS